MARSEHEIGILNQKVEEYLHSLLPKRDPVLSAIEKDAAKRGVPIIGPLVGTVISMFVRSAEAENALEIGTATGYSAIWISRALHGRNRKLTTIEMDEDRRRAARRNFEKAGVAERIEILAGNAKVIVPKISETQAENFGVVFLDVGDKTLYVELLEPCLKALRVGGFLIADNTLWGGEVANPKNNATETETIRRFNELVFGDRRLDAAIIPLRDGFTVAHKKKQ
ncbi:MAG: O-methyltransferase [Nitrososphaerales archaeon]